MLHLHCTLTTLNKVFPTVMCLKAGHNDHSYCGCCEQKTTHSSGQMQPDQLGSLALSFHIKRHVNSVAHTLARAVNSWTSFHRFEIIPLCIEPLVINEMY
ncbi:hypothetical protein QL285_020252 [Trifolium repens]|nr:hypothetical protein QL285_020252 [Trifolium repens]